MQTRIRAALALASLLTAFLFSSAIALPASAQRVGSRHSRAEKCQVLDDTMQFFFGVSIDRPGCLKHINDNDD